MTSENDPVAVTMTPGAAERFKAALSYAQSVIEEMADVNDASETKARMEEHALWLGWGRSRVVYAQRERERDVA